MGERKVYLDYNATTPLEPLVLSAIHDALENAWGNPSSSYSQGVYAKEIIQKSRQSVASMISCEPSDIIFTSGGTEANNMVLQTGLKHFANTYLPDGTEGHKPHFITSNIEHDSVKLVLEQFQGQGQADVTYVQVSNVTGHVEVDDVLAAIRPTTCMVSIMMANNETGVIQPIAELMRRIRSVNTCSSRRILLHTDAAQTIGKVSVDIGELGVDYLTIVGHKFYGPRIGALYVAGAGGKDSAPLYPLLYGGGQERNLRPGTENTGMIAGLGAAAQMVADNRVSNEAGMRLVRDYLEDRLQEHFTSEEKGTSVHFNGKFSSSKRIPNTCNFSVRCKNRAGISGRRILDNCKHTIASVGAACHSRHNRGSHILLAMGVPEDIAVSAIRMSVGRHTTKEDIDLVVKDLSQTIDLLINIDT